MPLPSYGPSSLDDHPARVTFWQSGMPLVRMTLTSQSMHWLCTSSYARSFPDDLKVVAPSAAQLASASTFVGADQFFLRTPAQ